MPSNIRSDVFGVNPKVPWEVNAIDVLFLKGCGISPK
jgi:hypothetical protein